MSKLYDILARYQSYLLGAAIFMACLAVSFISDDQGFRLTFGEVPHLLVLFIIVSILMMWVYITLDKRKIKGLSQEISELEVQENTEVLEISRLTDRQLQVYQLIISGKSNKEIMSTLFIEQSTLKTHINQIYKKLGVASRKELKSR